MQSSDFQVKILTEREKAVLALPVRVAVFNLYIMGEYTWVIAV